MPGRAFISGLVAFLGAWTFVFVWGVRSGPTMASAVFAGLGTATTLVAASVALWAFRDGLRRPRITATIGRAQTEHAATELSPDRVAITGLSAHLRVVIVNEGDAPMRDGLVNIVVLKDCLIAPTSAATTPVGGLHQNDEIVPGDIREVRFVKAHRDFPVRQWTILPFEFQAPSPGDWPVLVRVDGHPGKPLSHVFRVVVTESPSRPDEG